MAADASVRPMLQRRRSEVVGCAAFFAVALVCLPANASHEGGAGAQIFAILFGFIALVASVVLGALSWATVFRPPKTVGWIFGRGFLGVSAIVTFAIGGLLLIIGFGSAAGGVPGWGVALFVGSVMLFFAIECYIAATLYHRSNTHQKSRAARALSAVSYVLAGLFSLATCLMLVITVIAIFAN